MTTKSFLDRLNSGDIMVADGAMGTNLQARGLEKGKPSEKWLFERPKEICQLHKDFILAGANIILTNTFGANAIRLKAAGMKDSVEVVNQLAVEIAREAIGNQDVYIAGSIGPSGGLLKPYGPLDDHSVFSSFEQQAGALTQAQVDFLVIETQFDLNEAIIALKATRSVSDLPIICSFSFDRGTRTMMGITPIQVAEKISEKELSYLNISMLGINCGRSPEENMLSLLELRSATDLPIWYKPNAGLPKVDDMGGIFYDLTDHEMGELARNWIENGAQVVGGCCGTTPLHLRAISKIVSYI